MIEQIRNPAEKTIEKGVNSKGKFSKLQKRAEAFINKDPSVVREIPPQDVIKLVEELQIYQVELEMQNEELRREQIEIEQARDRYVELYDFAPVGYFTINDQGMILEANLAGATMLGVKKRYLINKPFSSFITADSQDHYDFHRRELLKTKARQIYDLKLERKGGSEFWVHLDCIVIQDNEGNFNWIRMAVVNIDKRKQAEDALKESKELFKKVFEGQTDAIFILTAGVPPMINDCNPAAAQIFGWHRQEMLGQTTELLHVNESTLKEFQDRRFSAIAEKGALHLFNFEMKRKDGTIFPTEHSVVPFNNEEGDCIGWVSVIRDISNRKKTEEEKNKYKEQFHLAQKMEIIGILAGGIAHDFNNLLLNIQGRTSIMLMEKDSSHPDFDYLKGVEANVDRAADLTRQLLNFCKNRKYEVKSTDLNELIKNENHMFAQTKKE
ncbi:MAG: PAS domain S-box protein, partial [Deltaproteobacteria bacterium]|nr:PAS domain S-box protein [Deltaproteobacteria bacterium]